MMTVEFDTIVFGLQRAYLTAVYDKDASALMRLYDPAVRVFDAWGDWEHDGAAAWRKAVDGWFGSLGDERVEVRFDATRTCGSGGSGFTSSIVTYAAVTDSGKVLRSMQNRLSWGIRCDGPEPVILHEHTSAPIGEDMKAILHRAAPAPGK